jgi:WD40 repeat protein
VAAAGFSPDGSRILTWSSDGTARIWDNGTIAGAVAPHTAAADAVAKAAGVDQNEAAGLSLQQPAALETPVRAYNADQDRPDNELIVFNPLTGRRLAAIKVGASIATASFDGAGDLMLITGDDVRSKRFYSPAEIRRTHGGSLVRTFPVLAFSGELSPDGKLAAIVSPNDDISIWSVASGRRLTLFRRDQSPSQGNDSHQVWVSFSRDDAYVLSSDAEGRAFVWRPRTGHVVAEMRGDPEPVSGQWVGVSGAISPDDKLIVLARSWDDDADVYRLGSSRPLLTLLGNPDGIQQVVFSPDSQLIATLDAFTSEQVNVYDTQSQQPLFTIPDLLAQAVSFSADSGSVLTDQRFPYEIYPCPICGGFDQLLSAARQREIVRLTPEERYLYLR